MVIISTLFVILAKAMREKHPTGDKVIDSVEFKTRDLINSLLAIDEMPFPKNRHVDQKTRILKC